MRMSLWWILVPRASVSFGHVVREMCRKQSQTRSKGKVGIRHILYGFVTCDR